MRVTVVGLGLIGGSVALDMKALGFATRIVGVDSRAAHGREARARGLVDQVTTLAKAVKDADLVILATPVDGLPKLADRVLRMTGKGTTVTDMGSTKANLCRALAKHPDRARFVASHPMAGTENSGPSAALRGLFAGKAGVICEANRSGATHVGRVARLYRTLGMRLIHLSAEEHDHHVAYISHLSHVSSFVLANTVLEEEHSTRTVFELASGGFESTSRLAKSSPETWAAIFAENREPVLTALDAYVRQLQKFRRAIAARSPAESRKLMRNANRVRRILGRIRPPRPEGA